MVDPFVVSRPSDYAGDDNKDVLEPGKEEFFFMMGLDVITKGLLIMGYSESAIRKGQREIDFTSETMQEQIDNLSENLGVLNSKFEVSVYFENVGIVTVFFLFFRIC